MNFLPWPKIPRLTNEIFHITEKIDGTNACIVISEDGYVLAQSRSQFITPIKDNYGFANWVYVNHDRLFEDLGPGHHFGEWWGQGIQRNYGLNEKRFSLFNPTKQSSICYNVPIIKSEAFKFLNESIQDCKERLITHGSFAAPGFMKPEGLIIYGERSKCYWKVLFDED